MQAFSALFRRIGTAGPSSPAEHLLFYCLRPLGRLYALFARIRRRAYVHGYLSRYRAKVPVISIGNLSVGGTGKTPVTEWLLRFLQQSNLRVAVVSRGYGGDVKAGVRVVCAGGGPLLTPDIAGDEPYLLARRNPAAVIIAAARRSAGIEEAVARFGAQIVLLDDGFQHLAVARDLDIVLLDARYPFGNGEVLPAGMLREPPSALRHAHLVMLTRCQGPLPSLPYSGPRCVSRHRLAANAATLEGHVVPLESLRGQRGVAFAGIADPASFFSELSGLGLQLVQTLPLPDHYDYSVSARQTLKELGAQADYLITTEKDGVKLQSSDFSIPCYQVPLDLLIDDAEPLTRLLNVLLTGGKSMPVREDLLKILACPQCKGTVRYEQEKELLVCEHCRLAYPVRDGIPVMLVDEAQAISD